MHTAVVWVGPCLVCSFGFCLTRCLSFTTMSEPASELGSPKPDRMMTGSVLTAGTPLSCFPVLLCAAASGVVSLVKQKKQKKQWLISC